MEDNGNRYRRNDHQQNSEQSMFSGSYGTKVVGGTMSNIGRDQINNVYHTNSFQQGAPAKTIREALEAIEYSYRYDSRAQRPYSKVPEGPRFQKVTDVLLEWAGCSLLKKGVPGVYWLQGSEAAERTAVAQKLAKACEGKELLATFFFSSQDPNRNNPRYLVLAIVHEMSLAISSIRNRILGIVEDRPDILQASIETQFGTLVVGNFLSWRSKLRDAFSPSRVMTASSTLIIIDGLDECLPISEQEQVLLLVYTAMEKRLPVRFLICSRPEPEIQQMFNRSGIRQYMETISLDSYNSNPLAPPNNQNSRYPGGR